MEHIKSPYQGISRSKIMSISKLDKAQVLKVVKALAYAFVSSFAVALLASDELSKAALYAALVAGVNGALVTVKQLFTPVGE